MFLLQHSVKASLTGFVAGFRFPASFSSAFVRQTNLLILSYLCSSPTVAGKNRVMMNPTAGPQNAANRNVWK